MFFSLLLFYLNWMSQYHFSESLETALHKCSFEQDLSAEQNMSALCWFNSLLIEFKMLVVKKKVTSPSIPPTYNFTSLHLFWFVKQTKKEGMSSSAEIGKHHFRYMSHCFGFDSSIVLYFGVKTNNCVSYCVVLYFWNNNTSLMHNVRFSGAYNALLRSRVEIK